MSYETIKDPPLVLIFVLMAGCQQETPIPSPTYALPTSAPLPTVEPDQPTVAETGIGEGSVLLTGDGQEVILSTYLEVSGQSHWAVGSRSGAPNLILYSGDGGQSWADRSPPESTLDPSSYSDAIISFWDESTGWVIYDGSTLLWKTTDAGLAWESYSLDIAASEFSMIDILNQDTAWVMIITIQEPRTGNITLYRTLDGGNTWEVMLDPSDGGPNSFSKNGFSFGTTEYGWIARDQGHFIKPYLDITRDGGKSWEMINFPPPPAFPDISMIANVMCLTLK